MPVCAALRCKARNGQAAKRGMSSVNALMKTGLSSGLAAFAAFVSTTVPGFAAQPEPWQMTLQPAATEMMASLVWFEQYTLWFIVPITLFVAGLLLYVCVKFRRSANPVPSRTSHNTLIEVVWTVVPVLILVAIAFPSFALLNAQYSPPREAELTVKATGVQWYWSYEYQVGETPITFDSIMLADADRPKLGKEDTAAYPYLLAVDNEMVVPVGTVVRVLVTASDVLHAFAMPAFGLKSDAVPGRMNEVWFLAEKEGLFYGQCSELCGKDHAYMPIAIRVVSKEDYTAWQATAAADLGAANTQLIATLKARAAAENAVAANN
jgi:cytochrome c oxidase subunit II